MQSNDLPLANVQMDLGESADPTLAEQWRRSRRWLFRRIDCDVYARPGLMSLLKWY